MNAHAKIKSAALGSNVAEVEMASEAVARSAAAYRIYPNFPECQDVKASYWNEYQRCVVHMMEVLSRG